MAPKCGDGSEKQGALQESMAISVLVLMACMGVGRGRVGMFAILPSSI